ncbi:response regulator transcription factor [Calditerricola satsumensis]|uniref:DNA-binding response regulator n=1 Tax=Calditerricola satsumensis TaxID=373054 RepID=A0A8J3B7C6_9BACI|nr:response regulator transcription factor [Calditerricola satsumensis]GGJ98629.1 DNA-binding response regulator [Calditerricola satsumensis]
MHSASILVVEDDRDLHRLVATYLRKEGYAVDGAYTGQEALVRARSGSYHLVVLDLMLPDIDGFAVLRDIREASTVPVIILSAKGEEWDKVMGLGIGADDYLTKPFRIAELIARVKAQLRRYLVLNAPASAPPRVMRYGDLELHLDTYEVRVGGKAKPLTAKEYALLKLFLEHPGRVFTKAQLFERVWKEPYLGDDNTVMVHIRRLRAKIEPNPSQPQYIQTVWGIGYKLGGGRNTEWT